MVMPPSWAIDSKYVVHRLVKGIALKGHGKARMPSYNSVYVCVYISVCPYCMCVCMQPRVCDSIPFRFYHFDDY